MAYFTNKFDNEVERLLMAGGVGFMPSDTVYGLSAAALNESAVGRLHSIKKRPADKPFIILFSDSKILNMLSILENQIIPAQKFWPGGLTLICDAPKSPSWLNLGTQMLAVRMPGSHKLLRLIDTVGPLVSTSANPGGKPPARNLSQAISYFGDNLDFYVDAGNLNGEPSTIVRERDGKLEVIRPGAVKI